MFRSITMLSSSWSSSCTVIVVNVYQQTRSNITEYSNLQRSLSWCFIELKDSSYYVHWRIWMQETGPTDEKKEMLGSKAWVNSSWLYGLFSLQTSLRWEHKWNLPRPHLVFEKEQLLGAEKWSICFVFLKYHWKWEVEELCALLSGFKETWELKKINL